MKRDSYGRGCYIEKAITKNNLVIIIAVIVARPTKIMLLRFFLDFLVMSVVAI